MKTYKLSFKDRIKNIDPVLFWCSLAISIISLVTLVCGYEVFGARRLIMQLAMTVMGVVAHMNLGCPDIRRPDGCILFDMEPEESMARILGGRTADQLEIYETTAQQEAIRARFHRIRDLLEGRDHMITVNAAGSIEEVTDRVLDAYERIRSAAEV